MLDKTAPSKEKVFLLVDDNLADRMLFRELIQKSHYFSDYSIVEADSSEEALSLLKDTWPTCCLVDYQLPADNGLDLPTSISKTCQATD